MSANRSASVVQGVAQRTGKKLLRNPGQAISPVLVPLFTFVSFTGALSAISSTQGFNYYNFTAFEFVFVLLTATAFVGGFSSFDVLFDFQGGMGRRLMLAAPQRLAILGGYLIIAFLRGLLALALVWIVAAIIGMPVRGNVLDVLALCVLAMLLNVATFLYGAGLALRVQAMAAATLIFIPTFMAMFLTPVFTTRQTMSGALKAAASVNPLTAMMESGRGFLAGKSVSVALAFAAAVGLVVLFAVWAARGMRAAERKG